MYYRSIALIAATLLLAACSKPGDPTTSAEMTTEPVDYAATVTRIADRYYSEALERTPEIAYFAGVELDRHDGIRSNHPDSRSAAEASIDDMYVQLMAVDSDSLLGTPEWITHAYLEQALGAEIGERICRTDLWNINQMGGWHSGYSQIAQLQPVGTGAAREQSLARWSKLAEFVDQEISNLSDGLKQGYSAPKTVVQRVIDQVDGLLALETEQSPFYSPAVRDDDPEFAEATREIVENQINPSLQSYRNYLANTYIKAARDALSITANPNGKACYEASLKGYTTLDRSAKDVYELGRQVVESNKQAIADMGEKAYGVSEFSEILSKAKEDPENRFADAEELLAFSKEMVERAAAEMPGWVGTMPTQAVEVVPFEEHEEGTGRSAHYNPASKDRPGEYRIPLHKPEDQSRGNAEATAFHEAWPGHHLQVAVSQSVDGLHPVTQIVWFSGPGEGWARYSEALAEEMGLYTTTSGPILRRAWPARGMVIDPGLHLYGWTREQVIEFAMESGRFPDSMGDELVDRIAIIPGQLTAYDSGGLEILALRKQAEAAMGEEFDIREFHDRVLENGTIPLGALRRHIENWIAEENAHD